MPWTLVSGTAITVKVPGDSVQIYELELGGPLVEHALEPSPLPRAKTKRSDSQWEIRLKVPDEDMSRCDLLIEIWKLANSALLINGEPVEPTRYSHGNDWVLASYDLRPFRGKTLSLSVSAVPFSAKNRSKKKKSLPTLKVGERALMEAWLVVDRLVEAPAVAGNEVLPLPIGQNFRRQTQSLVKERAILVGE